MHPQISLVHTLIFKFLLQCHLLRETLPTFFLTIGLITL